MNPPQEWPQIGRWLGSARGNRITYWKGRLCPRKRSPSLRCWMSSFNNLSTDSSCDCISQFPSADFSIQVTRDFCLADIGPQCRWIQSYWELGRRPKFKPGATEADKCRDVCAYKGVSTFTFRDIPSLLAWRKRQTYSKNVLALRSHYCIIRIRPAGGKLTPSANSGHRNLFKSDDFSAPLHLEIVTIGKYP